MRFVNDLPVENGATDCMDSCRLAGLMAIVGYSQPPQMSRYVIGREGVRHPVEFPSNNPKNFTRDQLVLLTAGLYAQKELVLSRVLLEAAKDRGWRAQNTEADAPGTTKQWPDGPDVLAPSVQGHLRRCAGLKASWLEDLALYADILFYGVLTPTEESNQLIAMSIVAGPKFVKFFAKYAPNWEQTVREYWSGWRGEPGVAESVILTVKSIAKRG